MENEICIIKINDQEHSDLYPDLLSVEVEEDEQLAGVFNLRLSIVLKNDGSWSWIDDERLKIWNKVTISAGFINNVIDVLTGYITQITPYFSNDLSQCYIDIRGMDGTVLMNREEKLKAWKGKKDSAIARDIFTKEYQFTVNKDTLKDTNIDYKEDFSTTTQRETDIQFLRRLARRNGYECFVRNNEGYFRPPQLSGKPQKLLAIQFGKETNLNYYKVEINGFKPTNVEMYHLDLFNKESLRVAINSTTQSKLGKSGASDVLTADVKPAKLVLKHSMANGQPVMQLMSQSLYDDANWFVFGEGEINSIEYQDVLRARELVTIKGVGETYSGVYYVTKVKHVFTEGSYTQRFKVKRNAIFPDGSENFGSGSLTSVV